MKKVSKISIKKVNGGVAQELRNLGALVEDNGHKISAVAEQFGDIKQTLDSHGQMIGKLAEDMEIVKTNVEFMKDSLKKKVDYDDFIALERRVHTLESKSR